MGILPGKKTGVGCHFVLQGNLPDPGIEPASPTRAGGLSITEPPGEARTLVGRALSCPGFRRWAWRQPPLKLGASCLTLHTLILVL